MLPNYRYKGRHRAPSSVGEAAVKVAAAGAVAALPVVAAPAANAAPDHVWDRLAECESSGDWAINTGNGYYGGLQFHPQTWRGFGGEEFAPMAHQASRAEQIVVAERVLGVQGWNAWPACSRKLGIRGHGADLRDAPQEAAPQTSPQPGAPARPGRGDTYSVKAGDTLSGIAAVRSTTWQHLHGMNPHIADPDRIHPGDVLDVTGHPVRPGTPAPKPTPQPKAEKVEASVAAPMEGRVSSGFGMRNGRMHDGVDIAAPIGTPQRAVAAGEVIAAGPASGFGLWVRIRHDDGAVTTYGHMNTIKVKVGERVAAGDVIATCGARGNSTGPHLHFEVEVDGRSVDPLPWLAARGVRY